MSDAYGAAMAATEAERQLGRQLTAQERNQIRSLQSQQTTQARSLTAADHAAARGLTAADRTSLRAIQSAERNLGRQLTAQERNQIRSLQSTEGMFGETARQGAAGLRFSGAEGLMKAGQGLDVAKLARAGALENVGINKWKQGQRQRDFDFGEFLREKDMPYRDLQAQTAVMSGTTWEQPEQKYYQSSGTGIFGK
jgi:hypothetical protein